jgi:hypothetical protein
VFIPENIEVSTSLFLFNNHAYLHCAVGSENQFYLSFDMPQANMPNSVVFLCHSCCNAATLIFTLRRWFGEPILSVVRHAASEHGEQRGGLYV